MQGEENVEAKRAQKAETAIAEVARKPAAAGRAGGWGALGWSSLAKTNISLSDPR